MVAKAVSNVEIEQTEPAITEQNDSGGTESQQLAWPKKEVSEICKILKIPDINDNDFDISVGEIKKAVMEHHDTELKEKTQKSSKMEKVKDEDFSQIKDYLKVKSSENTRMAFNLRCHMVEEIKGNFKAK